MSLRFVVALGLFGVTVAPLGACSVFSPSSSSSPDDGVPDAAAIRDYCAKVAALSTFACCSPADKALDEFKTRYAYADADQCATDLRGQDLLADGKVVRKFDADKAQRCLDFYGSLPCGFIQDQGVAEQARAAGCDSIVGGVGEAGAACTSSDVCKDGLHCALPAGAAAGTVGTCAAPVAAGGDCANTVTDGGSVQSNIDLSGGYHPTCADGFTCSSLGTCVALAGEGAPCLADDSCANGLSCRLGKCGNGPTSAEGGPCNYDPDCNAGDYCTTDGTCAPRKAAGASCTRNIFATLFHNECAGYCDTDLLGGNGTCKAFCGSK